MLLNEFKTSFLRVVYSPDMYQDFEQLFKVFPRQRVRGLLAAG